MTADAQTLREIAERVGLAVLEALGEADDPDLNSAAGTLLDFNGTDHPKIREIARKLGEAAIRALAASQEQRHV